MIRAVGVNSCNLVLGHDLRELPLIERKRSLRKLIPAGCDSVLYVDHIEGEGERLFELACERDLEGIVAKSL